MRKKIFILLITVCISLCISACDITDNHAVSLTEISQSGVISYESFSLMGAYYTNSSDSLHIPFKYNSKYGYADQDGNPVIENLEGISLKNFTENFAFVDNTVIDHTGKTVFTLPKDVTGDYFKDGYSMMLRKEHVPNSPYMQDYNIYVCSLDTNMNYEENKIMLPDGMHIGYEKWYAINEDGYRGALGMYGSKTTDPRIAITDSQGKIIAAFDANTAYKTAKAAFSFVNISASITHAKPVGLYDVDLNKMIFFKNGYVNVMNENGRWGLLNLETNKLIVNYSYDFVGAYSDDLIPVCQYGTWGAIDIKGNTVIPCQSFKYIGAFVNGRALAISEDENICVIDKKGNIIRNVDISVSGSTLSGSMKSFFYTDFNQTTHIACIYLYEKAYIISDSGDVLLSANTKSYSNINSFLYMNNKYLVISKEDGKSVYKINN